MTKVAIALGGNTGNVELTFKKAIKLLRENGLKVIKVSNLYLNPASGCIPGTPDFKNAALTGEWQDTAEELLNLCQKIEITLGRPKDHYSNQSRTIDLDIILFGEQQVNSERLKVPHPGAQSRDFVLIPLSRIAPDWIFPDTKQTITESLDKLKKEKHRIPFP